MKQVYSNIERATGIHLSGTILVKILPIEWLASPVTIDHNTGKVVSSLTPSAGKSYIDLKLLEESYDFDEKPKQTKDGPIFETSIAGVTNEITPELLQTLMTLSNHRFIAIASDCQGRRRLIGNQEEALEITFHPKDENKSPGFRSISILLSQQFTSPAPFVA